MVIFRELIATPQTIVFTQFVVLQYFGSNSQEITLILQPPHWRQNRSGPCKWK